MNLIKHNFGSYRGYLTHLQALVGVSLGRYASAGSIEWLRVSRLVFVCKGNVCRSPYAEARALDMGFPAVSFGLDTSGNVPANPAALRVARLRNVDLSAHRSRQFEASAVSAHDLLLAFQPDHYEHLVVATRGSNSQVSLLGIWPPPGVRPYLADPYGKSDQYFQRCFEIIDASVGAIISTLPTGHRLLG